MVTLERSRICAAVLLTALSTHAGAQATANAVTSAEDAFGTSEGAESVGIYDQTAVRGFNLESAGNYRIDGRYFVKNSGVSSFFFERTTVRVGYNALQLDHPGPSGVVDYRLRDPARGEPSQLTVGLDSYQQPYTELHFKHRSASDSFSASIGASRVFASADEQGGDGRNVLFAGTARITPSENTRLQVFGGEYRYARSGRFRIALAPGTSGLPDEIPRGRYLGQSWATEEGARRIFGGLVDLDPGHGWFMRAIGVFSQEDPDSKFTQLFADVAEDGTARSLVIASPAQRSTSYSSELTFGRAVRSGAIAHRASMNVRWRASTNHFGGESLIDAGTTVLGQRAVPVLMPDLESRRSTSRDGVDQAGIGLAYRISVADRMVVNAGVLYSDYAKHVTDAAGARTSSRSAPWLYSLGTAVALAPDVQLYGSVSRGLEEAGTAPATASNANTVLEAALATQRELGVRFTLPNEMRFIVAGFQTRKPQVGLDARTRAFSFIGDVEHRGVEASVSGSLGKGLTAIVGAVYIRPEVSGTSVQEGLIGERAVGVPSRRAIANLNWEATPRLSLDVGIEYIGEHAARSTLMSTGSQLSIPAAAVVDVGARYRFHVNDRPIVVRAQVLNALDEFAWRTAPGETLDYLPQRTLRVLATAEF